MCMNMHTYFVTETRESDNFHLKLCRLWAIDRNSWSIYKVCKLRVKNDTLNDVSNITEVKTNYLDYNT